MGTDYVWYASYGSNINKDRFLCYIKGGQPKGSTKIERGCKDSSLPIDEKVFVIPHQLYFAKEARQWNNQGVAFIDLEKNPKHHTYSYMYLLTKEQFIDVVNQENSLTESTINLEEVSAAGSVVFNHSWYGNILYLGESGGYPVFTFTSPNTINKDEIKEPSKAYLNTIIFGLKREVGLSNQEIREYFLKQPGMDHFSIDVLEELIKKADTSS